MARDTNARIKANLRFPKFKKLIEEAKLMVQQQGKKGDAAYHVLEHMNLEKHENNPVLFSHTPDRQLAELLGMDNPEGGGKTTVWMERQRLIRERWGIEKVVKHVDISKVKVIGSGSEAVYLYYFPTYQLFNKLCLEVPYFPCNIGKTIGDVKDRVSDQIGQQLSEKPRIALIIKTDDCEGLETKVHNELKRRGCWLDPKSGADVVGVEWFLTNPAQVEGIVKSIYRTRELQ